MLPEFNHNSKNKATCRELNYAFDAQEEYPFNSITIAFMQQLYIETKDKTVCNVYTLLINMMV